MHNAWTEWQLNFKGSWEAERIYVKSIVWTLHPCEVGLYFVWSGHWWYEMCLESIHVLLYSPSYSDSELEWPDEWEAISITVEMKGIKWKSWTQGQEEREEFKVKILLFSEYSL